MMSEVVAELLLMPDGCRVCGESLVVWGVSDRGGQIGTGWRCPHRCDQAAALLRH
jgi:hypothetical protein